MGLRYIGHILPRLEVSITIKKLLKYKNYYNKLIELANSNKQLLYKKRCLKGLKLNIKYNLCKL